ncbi:MAG: GGDEF domain-containing protein [Ectothiorhodospiraceae bacterium]|nr:GGDEF domain-containing protein [Ectothiorhodospiraceae bacterium]
MPPTAERKFSALLDSVLGLSFDRRHIAARAVGALGIAVLLGVVALIVYLSGGTKTAYIHLAYIPILFAAAQFGIVGGVLVAIIAGLGIAGPIMPMDVASDTPQPLASWMFRATFFLIFGIACGLVIGHLRKQLQQIRTASLIHPATGLPTHLALERFIAELLSNGEEAGEHGLVMIDIKNFDQIFNTLGPEFMQHIPSAVARRQRQAYPHAWQIYHVHSGKIAILVDEGKETTRQQARKILYRLSRPVRIDNVPVYLDAAVGAVSFSTRETEPAAILQRANAALATARRDHGGLAAYEDLKAPDRAKNIRLLTDAPSALDTGQFTLVYQPQYRLADHRIIGAEALIRWHHPIYGLVSPGQFIPLLEETAVINELTRWVARTAIRQAVEWQSAGLNLSVAINVSPRNLENEHLPSMILEELANHRLGANRLELEVTESAIIDDPMVLRDSLRGLKDAGVSVALDDFGAGFTSVRHLTTLPIDKLKIDRTLVDRVASDRRRMRIVSALTSMAKDLDLHTVAEGIEDADTLEFLKREGCDTGQGYYFSKPILADEMVALLEPTRHTFH